MIHPFIEGNLRSSLERLFQCPLSPGAHDALVNLKMKVDGQGAASLLPAEAAWLAILIADRPRIF